LCWLQGLACIHVVPRDNEQSISFEQCRLAGSLFPESAHHLLLPDVSVRFTAAGAIPNVSERLGTVERPLSLPEPVPFVGKIPFHIHVDPSDLIDQGSKAGKIHFDEMIDGNVQEMFHCAYGCYYSVSEG